MKKKLVMSMIAGLMLCSLYANAAETESEEFSMNAKELVTAIDEVNQFDHLLDAYDSLDITYAVYGVEYYTVTEIYVDADTYISKSQDDMLIDDQGDVYGYSSSINNNYYRYIFPEGDYEYFVESYEAIPWYAPGYLDASAVTYQEEDGILTVRMEVEMTDSTKESIAADYSLETENVDCWVYEYLVDADSMLITHMSRYIRTNDTSFLFTDAELKTGTDPIEIPSHVQDTVFAEDVRTATLVLNPGTEDEQTYTQTIGKGYNIAFFYDRYNLYADAECTTEYTGEGISSSDDFTIYLTPAE